MIKRTPIRYPPDSEIATNTDKVGIRIRAPVYTTSPPRRMWALFIEPEGAVGSGCEESVLSSGGENLGRAHVRFWLVGFIGGPGPSPPPQRVCKVYRACRVSRLYRVCRVYGVYRACRVYRDLEGLSGFLESSQGACMLGVPAAPRRAFGLETLRSAGQTLCALSSRVGRIELIRA